MGFCFFNNVAIAAQMAVRHWGVKKVAIVDWDVHHGNGTQNMFLDDKSILYFSVHRYDYGGFYPGSRDAGPHMVGRGEAQGYNINVGWNERLMGDEPYRLCFQHVLVPILTDFKPDLILVSAGFDAARGDPLGGCDLTPAGYATLTSMLMPHGKVVLVLEGGYNLESISESFAACTEVLLGNRAPVTASRAREFEEIPRYETQRLQSCVKSVLETIKCHVPYWPSLAPFAVLMKEFAALLVNSELKAEVVNQVTAAMAKVALTETESVTKSTKEGHYAPAKHFCTHATVEHVQLPVPRLLPKCCACEANEEVWMCLSCHFIGCGRHAQGHMAMHVEETGHPIALGFDDLSFWCYQCDSYLHHLLMGRIFEVYSQMCEIKFGERPAPELFQGRPDATEIEHTKE